MASVLFPAGREGILDGTIDMSGVIRAMLATEAYVFSDAHKFLVDVVDNDNGRSANLGSKTYADGVFGAADTSLIARTAAASNALVIFEQARPDSISRLIAYIDDTGGLPFTPAVGQSVNIMWDTGVNRIFRL